MGNDNTVVEDLILSCTGGKVSSETAQRAIRALCRYYGGLMLYIPAKKETGASAEKLLGIIADAVGSCAAEEIVSRIIKFCGNMQIYFPLERTAFRKTIALEIYERCGKDGISMNDLAREYGISFSHAYSLWREGRHEKFLPSMPFLPFLEMAESNNPD